jgi:hypothetical protein
VSFEANHIHGPLPEFGENNTGYQNIYLGQNQFQGTIPQSFLNLQSLQELDLRYDREERGRVERGIERN